MYQQPVVSFKTYCRTLNILFLAMVAGQVMFALISTFLVLTQTIAPAPFAPEVMQILFGVIPLLAVAGIVSGRQIFAARLNVVRNKPAMAERLSGYQSLLIVKYALMEGPCLAALVIFYLTGNFIFLGIAVAVILAFILNRPSKHLIVEHLQLHDDEQFLSEDGAMI